MTITPRLRHFGKTLQRRHGEADAARVMGVGENQHLCPLVNQGLKMIQVHFIGLQEAVLVIYRLQRVVHDLEAAGHSHIVERVVDRRLDYHLVAWLKKASLSEAYTFHYPRNIAEMLRGDLPAMQGFNPRRYDLEIVGPCGRVAQNRMVKTTPQRVYDEIRCSEIHVGYPEGSQI